jgi:hypothetical protein
MSRCVSVGRLAQHEKPEVVGEVDLADQVVAQIMAAHRDACGVRRGDGREGVVLFSDAHGSTHFFAMRKLFLLPKTMARPTVTSSENPVIRPGESGSKGRKKDAGYQSVHDHTRR